VESCARARVCSHFGRRGLYFLEALSGNRIDKVAQNRLAVLPFQNLIGDPNKDYLADGLTEEMISQLGQLNPERLGVIARTSVMGYKHKDVRLDQIGRDLSVQYVLENSLRESGNHIRLTAQLITGEGPNSPVVPRLRLSGERHS
jgi:TolB-like protein